MNIEERLARLEIQAGLETEESARLRRLEEENRELRNRVDRFHDKEMNRSRSELDQILMRIRFLR